MTKLVEWFVCGLVFGVGVKGGMALYDYSKSDKAKAHFQSFKTKLKTVNDKCSEIGNKVINVA